MIIIVFMFIKSNIFIILSKKDMPIFCRDQGVLENLYWWILLERYFLGNKELFQDTFIYDKIDENNIHPIILLDFANISYKELGLKDALIRKVKKYW